jgi:aerobic carbon-monoxide dehydrogenase medium subunit
LLSDTALEPGAVEAAGAACVAAADPTDDIRASADYRAHLLPIYVRRVLGTLQARRSQGVT